MKKLVKDLTMAHFSVVVPWAEIEEVMGKRRYKKFCHWMRGQTVSGHGVYPDDLRRFLKGLPVID